MVDPQHMVIDSIGAPPKEEKKDPPFAYGGPAGRSEFFELPKPAPERVGTYVVSQRLRELVQQKIQLIDQINKFYGREDGRFRRATDLVKVGGAEAGKSRDGLSSLSAVIAEHGLYSQEVNNFIDGALGNINRQIDAEKEHEYRRNNWPALVGRMATMIAGGLLAAALLGPVLALLPFSIPILTGLTGGLAAVLGAGHGVLGALVGIIGIGGGQVMERVVAPRTRPAFDLSAIGYPANRAANYVDPETPAQARRGMRDLARDLNGLDLPKADKMTALGAIASQNDQMLPRTHRTTQPRGI